MPSSKDTPVVGHTNPGTKPPRDYFVTTTAAKRAHIFERGVIKRILVDGLYHLHVVDSASLYAFVIMPNHVHFIISCEEDDPLANTIRDFKANTARLIVRQFQAERDQPMLDRLAAAVTRPTRQRFKVWDDGYVAKEVFAREFFWQKLEYIHNNPLQRRWNLADRAADYVWSSARFYELGEPALIPLADARQVWW